VRFADNGKGVDPAYRMRIFDAFFTTYAHGTGLGLALIRRIIDDHHGSIIESGVLGEGAVFEIYLPSVEIENSKPRVTDKGKRKLRTKKERG